LECVDKFDYSAPVSDLLNIWLAVSRRPQWATFETHCCRRSFYISFSPLLPSTGLGL